MCSLCCKLHGHKYCNHILKKCWFYIIFLAFIVFNMMTLLPASVSVTLSSPAVGPKSVGSSVSSGSKSNLFVQHIFMKNKMRHLVWTSGLTSTYSTFTHGWIYLHAHGPFLRTEINFMLHCSCKNLKFEFENSNTHHVFLGIQSNENKLCWLETLQAHS